MHRESKYHDHVDSESFKSAVSTKKVLGVCMGVCAIIHVHSLKGQGEKKIKKKETRINARGFSLEGK